VRHVGWQEFDDLPEEERARAYRALPGHPEVPTDVRAAAAAHHTLPARLLTAVRHATRGRTTCDAARRIRVLSVVLATSPEARAHRQLMSRRTDPAATCANVLSGRAALQPADKAVPAGLPGPTSSEQRDPDLVAVAGHVAYLGMGGGRQSPRRGG
jgi:hypothetical protein